MAKFTEKIAEKYHKVADKKPTTKKEQAQREKFKDIDDNINGELEGHEKKLIAPLRNIVGKTSESSKLYIVANVASVIFGIILLIFPDVSMTIWGLIFLYTGLPNLFAAIKAMGLVDKIRKKKFKEILSDIEKEQGEPEANPSDSKSSTTKSSQKKK